MCSALSSNSMWMRLRGSTFSWILSEMLTRVIMNASKLRYFCSYAVFLKMASKSCLLILLLCSVFLLNSTILMISKSLQKSMNRLTVITSRVKETLSKVVILLCSF